jgi:hypothetical protein
MSAVDDGKNVLVCIHLPHIVVGVDTDVDIVCPALPIRLPPVSAEYHLNAKFGLVSGFGN